MPTLVPLKYYTVEAVKQAETKLGRGTNVGAER
jgi:hypothetical protein